ISPGRWQPWQFAWTMGATSRVYVTVGFAAPAGAGAGPTCSANRRAAPIHQRRTRPGSQPRCRRRSDPATATGLTIVPPFRHPVPLAGDRLATQYSEDAGAGQLAA